MFPPTPVLHDVESERGRRCEMAAGEAGIGGEEEEEDGGGEGRAPCGLPVRRHAATHTKGCRENTEASGTPVRSGLPGMGTRTGTEMATSGCFGVAGMGTRGVTPQPGARPRPAVAAGDGDVPSPLTRLRGGTHAAVG